MTGASPIVPDTEHRGLLGLLPRRWRPYALLARFDRPIGWWLLFLPCAWGALLSGLPDGGGWRIGAMLLGAIAMRGSGCVYNDIVDRDLDAQVERTRSRPLPSGAVSMRAAWIWLGVLLAIGFGVWLAMPWPAKLWSLATLPVVAAYPFMKRITWWPQAFLGIVFGSGALVGFVAGDPAGAFASRQGAGWWLYAGTILWVIGYDTIYALQDVEDDAIVGVRSSARRMGTQVRGGVALLYALALALWAMAFWTVRPDPLALLALLPAALHLFWQIVTLTPADGANALRRFRANRDTGFLMLAACAVVGMSGL
ncbi:4-hydroxybenzoate octaprenyltransferase [Sphingomonas sp. HT-1]|uniref:4-hydroxybenzoate octaprenyltransferase n=1 Tax=unclassified Sphingomonas TaxID=196159 RepID=UPI0002F1D0A2|nr:MULTISPECIES: 4-hydroxybenzoate octaprenyltransferase [unclassified Sphingomonas]KTF67371.1 4-hydroxybenzoate octaprenyltransferase [Sphingomonas sp. WG]